jgi:hypothetical protein
MLRNWYYKDFKNYVKSQGFELLKEDYKFIQNVIYHMPENEQKRVLRNYCHIWNTEMALEEKIALKQNVARFKANSYLREKINNFKV